jgi:hypothetical protein
MNLIAENLSHVVTAVIGVAWVLAILYCVIDDGRR